MISQNYALGSALFTNANINLDQVTFNINNHDVTRPDIGQVFATLKIPSVGIEKQIVHGDGEYELKKVLDIMQEVLFQDKVEILL